MTLLRRSVLGAALFSFITACGGADSVPDPADTDTDTSHPGDGDGDPGDGDGDGSGGRSTGDGDGEGDGSGGDEPGDGDGDGDGDPGDGDGDGSGGRSTGDGDGEGSGGDAAGDGDGDASGGDGSGGDGSGGDEPGDGDGDASGGDGSGGEPSGDGDGDASGGDGSGGEPSGDGDGDASGGDGSGGEPSSGGDGSGGETSSGGDGSGGEPSSGGDGSGGETSSGGDGSGGEPSGDGDGDGDGGSGGGESYVCEDTTPAVAGADLCAGVMCAPGGPGLCLDDTTYSGPDGAGVCMQGVCVYSSMETTCSSCTDGTCAGATSCADGCTNPPAPSCKADGTTLVSYAPVGTCSAGSCTYTQINTYCTAGCFDGACLPGSTYEVLPVTNATSTSRTLRMALDGNDRVYIAEQQGGTVQLYKRGSVGWYRINIEAGSDVSLAVRSDGTAYVAYIGASNTPRLATIAPNDTVSLSLVSLNASAAPSVAIDAAGKPVVAYVDTLASPDQLRVAVPGTSPWTSELAHSVGSAWSGMMTSVAVHGDGALHVLVGSRGERATGYNTAIYASKPAGGSWTANTSTLVGALTSPSSPMILDDNGDALVFYHAVGIPSYTVAGPSNYALVARFAPGQAPVKEVLGTASNEDPPRAVRYWDDSIGAVNLSGYSWHRSAQNLWYATGTTVAAIDVAVGLDGALRTIINKNYSWQVVTESCPRLALGNCGSDQCGGSVGECGECDVCDSDTRYCSEFSSERRDLYNPTVQHAALLTSGDFYLGLSPTESLIGDTGSWSPGPSGQIGSLYQSPDGEHLFKISTNIIERWNGSTWTTMASTLSDTTFTKYWVSNDGIVHAVRRKQDTVIHDIEYLRLTGSTWSSPETAFQHPLGIAYTASLVVDETNGSVQAVMSPCAYDWQGGGCGYVLRVRAPGGGWSDGAGLSVRLTEQAITPDGTIWGKYSCTSPTRYFYAYKPPGGAWVSEGCPNPGTQRLPDGKFLVDPGGTIQVVRQEYADTTYSRYKNVIHELNPNTGAFEAVREVPGGVVAYDALGDIHTFSTESVSGIQRFRHYFMP